MTEKTNIADGQTIIFCSCAYYDIVAENVRQQVYRSLIAGGVKVEAVADLCGMAARHAPELLEWSQGKSLKIVACYPRTLRWLFHVAGAPLPEQGVEFFNMRTQEPAEIVHSLLGSQAPKELGAEPMPGKTDEWTPWFPVIDYDRCVNCKQCLNFCLFGTFSLSDEGSVMVSSPSSCKTNCPACARVCPQKAIIFPKYGEPPINGDEVSEEDDEQGEDNRELGDMLKGNVYDMIRGRESKAKRFSMQPKNQGDVVAKPTMDQLRKKLDIPLDVLKSLSPAELKRVTKKSQDNQSGTLENIDGSGSNDE